MSPNAATFGYEEDGRGASKTFTVTGVDDYDDDGGQDYTLTVSVILPTGFDGKCNSLGSAYVLVQIIDDGNTGMWTSTISGETGEHFARQIRRTDARP